MIAWVYGSGFPKSLNIGKAVDKLQGNEREDLGVHIQSVKDRKPGGVLYGSKDASLRWQHSVTKGTSKWEGYGTALKPALEPITVARKPISEKTVAQNVLKYGTGGINIDGCRVEIDEKDPNARQGERVYDFPKTDNFLGGLKAGARGDFNAQGRFPANLIHDGYDEVVGLFPETGGGKFSKQTRSRKGFMLSGSEDNIQEANAPDNYGDSGSASRFFYCAKARKSERNRGCEEFEEKPSEANLRQQGRLPKPKAHLFTP
jgi:site-specific DNA-methyltransferase (adenine-specific)